MAKYFFQIVIPTSKGYNGRIGYGTVPINGTIIGASITAEGGSPGSGDTKVDVLKGTIGSTPVSIFADSEKLTLPAGQNTAESSDSAFPVACVKHQSLSVELIGVPLGGTGFPLTITLVLDDGQSSGGETSGINGFDTYGNFGPTIPATENDEFDGTSLNSKWTITDSGGTANLVSYNERVKSAYYVKSNAGHIRLITENFAPADDFSLTLCGFCEITEAYNEFGLGVRDSSGNNGYEFFAIHNGTSPRFASHKITSGSHTYDIGATVFAPADYNLFYLHLQRIGGNFITYFSKNGYNWTLSANHSFTLASIAKMYVVFGSNTGLNKTNSVIHWIRRDWLFL